MLVACPFLGCAGVQLRRASAPLGRVHGKLLHGHQKICPERGAVGPPGCTQASQQVRVCAAERKRIPT